MGQPDPAFEDLFAEEYPAMVHVAYLIVGDEGLAREIAQESFTRMLVRWRRLRSYDRPGAWLRRVTVRQAVRVRDRRVREGGQLDVTLLEGSVGLDHGTREAVVAAVMQLPRQQRAAVVLHYLDDLDTAEVAALMGTRPATVRVHLHRARARLEELLAEDATDRNDGSRAEAGPVTEQHEEVSDARG